LGKNGTPHLATVYYCVLAAGPLPDGTMKNRRKTVKEVKNKSLWQKKPRIILPEIGFPQGGSQSEKTVSRLDMGCPGWWIS